MSLRGFHVIFIAIAALLLFGLSALAFLSWQRGASAADLATGVGFLVTGSGLAAYGIWYFLKSRQLTT